MKNSAVAERIKKLPFIGIVIKNEESPINQFLSNFKPLGKIVEIENGKLQGGIKQAVKMYASENDEFAENMSENLKKELGFIKKKVVETVEETKEAVKSSEPIEEIKTGAKEAAETLVEVASDSGKNAKSGKGGKIAAIAAAITAGIGAVVMYFRKGEKS